VLKLTNQKNEPAS